MLCNALHCSLLHIYQQVKQKIDVLLLIVRLRCNHVSYLKMLLTFTFCKYSHNLSFVSIKNVYLNKKRNYLIIHSYFHLHQQCSLLWQTWYKIQNAVHLELMAQGSIVQLNAESKHGFDLIPFRLSSVLGHQMCVAFSKQIAYMTIKLPFMKSSCCIRQAHTTGAPKRRVYLSNSIV